MKHIAKHIMVFPSFVFLYIYFYKVCDHFVVWHGKWIWRYPCRWIRRIIVSHLKIFLPYFFDWFAEELQKELRRKAKEFLICWRFSEMNWSKKTGKKINGKLELCSSSVVQPLVLTFLHCFFDILPLKKREFLSIFARWPKRLSRC